MNPIAINYRDKDWLMQKYYTEGLSLRAIGKLQGVSNISITRSMERFNLKRRTKAEGKHYSNGNSCDLTKEAKDWINGELLGDGCIIQHGNYSAQFHYGSKHREYICFVSTTLSSFGIEQAGNIRMQGGNDYHYCSRSYPELLKIQKNWYINRKKTVPKDIELTPITCKQWFIGDGTMISRDRTFSYIVLCSMGFSSECIDVLTHKLNNIGFSTRVNGKRNITIRTISTKDFLEYIGDCPVDCYQYKWQGRIKYVT